MPIKLTILVAVVLSSIMYWSLSNICRFNYSVDKKTKILNELDKDKVISLISDAGTPLISDPGYKLLKRIRQSRHSIFSLPGPCSAIASLIISGLKTDKFCFLGFLD